MLEHPFGQEQRQQLALRKRHQWQSVVWFGIVVAVATLIEYERGTHPLSEKFDVTLHGSMANLQLAGDRSGIGILTSADGTVEGGDALQ